MIAHNCTLILVLSFSVWLFELGRYKQRGPEAAAAKNIFFYMTYEGAVDIDKITDPVRIRHLFVGNHFDNCFSHVNGICSVSGSRVDNVILRSVLR